MWRLFLLSLLLLWTNGASAAGRASPAASSSSSSSTSGPNHHHHRRQLMMGMSGSMGMMGKGGGGGGMSGGGMGMMGMRGGGGGGMSGGGMGGKMGPKKNGMMMSSKGKNGGDISILIKSTFLLDIAYSGVTVFPTPGDLIEVAALTADKLEEYTDAVGGRHGRHLRNPGRHEDARKLQTFDPVTQSVEMQVVNTVMVDNDTIVVTYLVIVTFIIPADGPLPTQDQINAFYAGALVANSADYVNALQELANNVFSTTSTVAVEVVDAVTDMPSSAPVVVGAPTRTPSSSPSASPVAGGTPSSSPSSMPSVSPAAGGIPSSLPSSMPSASPAGGAIPSSSPSASPAAGGIPSSSPSASPAMGASPTASPSRLPSGTPAPSRTPVSTPAPVTGGGPPSGAPTSPPSDPTTSPQPTPLPSSDAPFSISPMSVPTRAPSSSAPSDGNIFSSVPSIVSTPSAIPIFVPSLEPGPSSSPIFVPSFLPSDPSASPASVQPSSTFDGMFVGFIVHNFEGNIDQPEFLDRSAVEATVLDPYLRPFFDAALPGGGQLDFITVALDDSRPNNPMTSSLKVTGAAFGPQEYSPELLYSIFASAINDNEQLYIGNLTTLLSTNNPYAFTVSATALPSELAP